MVDITLASSLTATQSGRQMAKYEITNAFYSCLMIISGKLIHLVDFLLSSIHFGILNSVLMSGFCPLTPPRGFNSDFIGPYTAIHWLKSVDDRT